MSRQPATGAAAYHARLEVEKIAKLEARVAELEARLAGWKSPSQASNEVKVAVQHAYAIAHKDGYRSGWSDKACGVAPHQYPAPEQRERVMMMTAADR